MVSINKGYYYYPSKYSPPLGHPRLDVFLMDKPSDRSFEAHKAIFPVVEPDGFRELSVIHPWEDWMSPGNERICAGRFQLIDSMRRIRYGFSFGGNLKIQNLGTHTLCTITSNAPICNLMEEDEKSTEDLLVDEIEVLYAELMAKWGTNEKGFTKRMSEIEPLTLFAATLVELEKKIQKLPLEAKEHGYRDISHIIKETKNTLAKTGDWPSIIPSISDLI